ncbi:MAG: biotin--[acetyl-CoA-carboxylase] ligase [Eubacterium sp.]|nr:biotin--[acetyl-CoA-carboxylase] ligase [Eubacterium sp.]
MSVKTDVLALLEASRGKDLSGQDIARELGVSRTAIWKAVKSLEEEGYQVKAANNRGYRLADHSDLLSEVGISMKIKEKYRDRQLVVLKKIDSTNLEAKRRALEGAESGLLVLAEEQTAGKGRKGRGFYSPEGTGIYMSFMFRPEGGQAEHPVLITTAAAVAVARALRQVLGEEAQIKWVNDVYLRDRKVCGILTEAVTDFESGGIDWLVLGIGINYREPKGGFPEDIRDRAGAVCTDSIKVPRNDLVAAVANQVYDLYENLNPENFMDDYRAWSNVIGREVRFSSGYAKLQEDEWQWGTAIDIDEEGGLIVQVEGEKKVLRTGEITLRVVE